MRMNNSTSSGAWLLTLLFLISVCNFLDRQVLSVVQEQVKVDLQLSDSQLGLLALGFGLAHALFALPLGRLSDRMPRKTVLTACLTVWSAFTVVAGAANSFWAMFLARTGVGAGEAGVTPTSYSIISDKFTLSKRATALAVVGAGIPVGVMFSFFLGGLIVTEFGWRWTFVLFGAPGLLLALVFALTVETPMRGEADGIKITKQSGTVESLKHLLSTPAYSLVLVGAGLRAIAAQGSLAWILSYYVRRFEYNEAYVGMTLGPLFGIVGIIGIFSASILSDRLSRRDVRWYAWITAIAKFAAFPAILATMLVNNYALSLAFYGLAILCGGATVAITNALIQNTAPVHMRGTASALKTTVLTLIGTALGATLIGFLSDFFADETAYGGLRMALIVVGSANIISGVLIYLSSFWLKRDIENARQASEAATTAA